MPEIRAISPLVQGTLSRDFVQELSRHGASPGLLATTAAMVSDQRQRAKSKDDDVEYLEPEIVSAGSSSRIGLLVRAAGVDSTLLQFTPSDKSRYESIGAALIVSSLTSGAGLVAAMSGLQVSSILKTLLACSFAVAAFTLNRSIALAVAVESRWQRKLIATLPQVVLAVLLAGIVATPLALQVFPAEISAQIAANRAASVAGFSRSVSVDSESTSLSQQVAAIDRQIANAQQALALEETGRGGTRIPGNGAEAKVRRAALDDLLVQRSRLLQQQAVAARNNARRVDQFRLSQSGSPGLLERLEALNQLESKNVTLRTAVLAMTLLFALIYLLPLLIALLVRLRPAGGYELLVHVDEKYRITRKEIESLRQSAGAAIQHLDDEVQQRIERLENEQLEEHPIAGTIPTSERTEETAGFPNPSKGDSFASKSEVEELRRWSVQTLEALEHSVERRLKELTEDVSKDRVEVVDQVNEMRLRKAG